MIEPRRIKWSQRLPWFGVALLVVLIAATWLPNLDLPLGDSHHGRVLGRYGIQVRNLDSLGLVDSGFGTDWSPYASARYAHHPPLSNILYALSAWLFGQNAIALRLVGTLAGLATIPGLALLLRSMRLGWKAVFAALFLTIGTGFFWIFGSLVFGVVFVVWAAALLVRLANEPEPGSLLLGATAFLAFVTAMSSWPGMVFSGLAGIWLLRKRGFDRSTMIVGLSMLASVLVTVVWISASAGFGALAGQLEARTTELSFGLREFLIRQMGFLWRFLPVWYLLLAVPALIAGIRSRHTRAVVWMTLSIAMLFAVALPDNAYVHEYWNYWILVPVAVGCAALVDRFSSNRPRLTNVFVAAVALSGLVWIGGLSLGDVNQERFAESSEAGRLAKIHRPPPSQTTAWFGGLSAPRWLVYYWDLPPRPIDAAAMTPGDLALINTVDFDVTRLLERGVVLDESGDYVLIEMVPAFNP